MGVPHQNPPRWPRALPILALGYALLSLWPAAARAQVNPPPRVPVQPVPFQGDTATKRDYTLKGALVGGAITGVSTATAVAAFCADADSRPSFGTCVLRATAGLVAGAVPGLMVGGLIGGAIDKPLSRNEAAAWVALQPEPLGPMLWWVQVTLLRVPIGRP
jgi:hypothetical protein